MRTSDARSFTCAVACARAHTRACVRETDICLLATDLFRRCTIGFHQRSRHLERSNVQARKAEFKQNAGFSRHVHSRNVFCTFPNSSSANILSVIKRYVEIYKKATPRLLFAVCSLVYVCAYLYLCAYIFSLYSHHYIIFIFLSFVSSSFLHKHTMCTCRRVRVYIFYIVYYEFKFENTLSRTLCISLRSCDYCSKIQEAHDSRSFARRIQLQLITPRDDFCEKRNAGSFRARAINFHFAFLSGMGGRFRRRAAFLREMGIDLKNAAAKLQLATRPLPVCPRAPSGHPSDVPFWRINPSRLSFAIPIF